jgi:hypothetical protein
MVRGCCAASSTDRGRSSAYGDLSGANDPPEEVSAPFHLCATSRVRVRGRRGPGETACLSKEVVAVLLPAEKELRAVLARFAEARFRHDLQPTGHSSRELEDTTYTLCVMTGTPSVDEALAAADALLEQLRADRRAGAEATRVLAA